MKKVYDASVSASQSDLPTGSYVLCVKDMFDNPEKEYVALVYDIAEGVHAGHYSYDSNPNSWRGHCCYLSYKSEFALAHTRACLRAMTLSNPNFSAEHVWDSICDVPTDKKDFSPFFGKLFGAEIIDDNYSSHGNVYHQKKVDVYIPAEFVRNGSYVSKRGGHNA
jgi:hypothetical protein